MGEQSTTLPESIHDDRKVGDIQVKDLKQVIKSITSEIIKDLFTQVQLLTGNIAKLETENTNLRSSIKLLQEESGFRRREMLNLEDQVKRKNIIVKGLNSAESPREALKHLCSTTLNLDAQAINIRSVKRIYDKNNKMGVIAELNSEEEVYEILKNTRKLTGTQISIEKDLNSEKQIHKKVMLQLKKSVLQADRSQRVTVRDDRLRIADQWFFWNQKWELQSGRANGLAIMDQIYGKRINVDFNYSNIFNKINSSISNVKN